MHDKLSSEILEPFIDFVDIVELIYRVEDLDLKDLVDLMNHLDLVQGLLSQVGQSHDPGELAIM